MRSGGGGKCGQAGPCAQLAARGMIPAGRSHTDESGVGFVPRGKLRWWFPKEGNKGWAGRDKLKKKKTKAVHVRDQRGRY